MRTAALALLLCLQDPALFEETFAGGKLAEGWSWIR